MTIDDKPSDSHREWVDKEFSKNPISLRYKANVNLIRKSFNKKASRKKDIAQNVSLIDYCYSTNLKEGYNDMVKNIFNLKKNFYKLVKSKAINDRQELINDITSVTSTLWGKKDSLSFVTKYCFQFNQYFPIYDEKVRTMLFYLNQKYKFYGAEVSINALKGYETFYYVIDSFRRSSKFFKSPIDYKKCDEYLWRWAKMVSVQYKKTILKTTKSGKPITKVVIDWDSWYKVLK